MKGFSNFVRKHTGLCCVILAVLFGGPLFLWMVRKRRYEFGK